MEKIITKSKNTQNNLKFDFQHLVFLIIKTYVKVNQIFYSA